MSRLLIEKWSGLSKAINIEMIADLPTPVEQYKSLPSCNKSINNLWIKRDDLTHTVYGGNKIRKLEFIMGDVKQKNKKTVVTMGALGTNHGVATTIITQSLGLESRIYLFDQPITSHVRNNLKTMLNHGADLFYRKSIARTALSYYWSYIYSRDCYHLPAGGSNRMGCMAFVNAALEIDQQINTGDLPPIDVIVCPVGSSGTIAGLTLGFALINSPIRVMGIRVAPSHLGPVPICTTSTIKSLILKTYRLMKGYDPDINLLKEPDVWLDDSYYGEGYGFATEQSDIAERNFSQTDYPLESTYTAKAAAAAFNLCSSRPHSNILYWHTLNSHWVDTTLRNNINFQDGIRNIDQKIVKDLI